MCRREGETDMSIVKSVYTHPDDIFVWADGIWCYRCELWEMDYKSDDYGVIYVDTVEYDTFLERNKNGNK